MTIVLNVFNVGGSYCASIDFTPNGHRPARNLLFSKEVTYGAGDDPNAAVERLIADVDAEAIARGIDPDTIQNLASIRKVQNKVRSSGPEDADEAA